MYNISRYANKIVIESQLLDLDDKYLEELDFNFYINGILKIQPQREKYVIVLNEKYVVGNSIDFGDYKDCATIDVSTLAFYSKKKDRHSAIQYFIDEIQSFLLANTLQSYKLIIEDGEKVVFSHFFLVEKNQSTYYGIIDNERAYEPQPVGVIDTQNLLYFLELIKGNSMPIYEISNNA